jgi:hypothetical protein
MGIDLKKIIMIKLLVIQLNDIFSIGTFINFFTCFMFGKKSYAVKETRCIPTCFARTFLQKIKWIEYLEKTKFLVENIDRGIVKIMYVVLRLI